MIECKKYVYEIYFDDSKMLDFKTNCKIKKIQLFE